MTMDEETKHRIYLLLAITLLIAFWLGVAALVHLIFD